MLVPQPKTRRIMLVTAVTAMLTAGGTGLAFAYPGDSGEPLETGYVVVDENADSAGSTWEDCPEKNTAQLTYDKAGL